MAGVVAIANQKGGVGKTTTTHALASALVERDHRVLVVDLDPQACLTYSLGLDPEGLGASLHDVLGGRTPATEVAVRVEVPPARGGARGQPPLSLIRSRSAMCRAQSGSLANQTSCTSSDEAP